jgi:hypothetical protein
VFGYKTRTFIAVWSWVGFVFLAPLVWLALWPLGGLPDPALPLLAVGLALGLWGLCVLRLGLPRVLLLAYPLSVALAVALAWHSLVTTATGRAVWKGRSLPAPR